MCPPQSLSSPCHPLQEPQGSPFDQVDRSGTFIDGEWLVVLDSLPTSSDASKRREYAAKVAEWASAVHGAHFGVVDAMVPPQGPNDCALCAANSVALLSSGSGSRSTTKPTKRASYAKSQRRQRTRRCWPGGRTSRQRNSFSACSSAMVGPTGGAGRRSGRHDGRVQVPAHVLPSYQHFMESRGGSHVAPSFQSSRCQSG